METRANKVQIATQGTYEWGVADKMPLYTDLGAEAGSHPLKHCTLKHVVTSLVRKSTSKNSNLEMAAVLTYDAVARGGEVKFQSFSQWRFDYLANITDTKWHEPKTVDVYAMPRIPDERWWFCFYFVMGAYAMCENGLYRSPKQISDGLQNAVFPSLHKVDDN